MWRWGKMKKINYIRTKGKETIFVYSRRKKKFAKQYNMS